MGMIERISAVCDKQNISIKSLEKSLGMGNGTIRKWNSSYPSCDRALKVANFLHVSFEWLVTGTIEKNILTSDEKLIIELYNKLSPDLQLKVNNFLEIANYEPNIVKIEDYIINEDPIYTTNSKFPVPVLGYSAAGSPIMAIENTLTFIETSISAANFALYIKGESMEPVIHDCDAVFIKKTPFIENGEIGIIQINDDVTCKKFYDYSDRIELHSINPNFKPMIYFKDSLTNIQIIGKVMLTDEQKKNIYK